MWLEKSIQQRNSKAENQTAQNLTQLVEKIKKFFNHGTSLSTDSG